MVMRLTLMIGTRWGNVPWQGQSSQPLGLRGQIGDPIIAEAWSGF